MATESLHDRDQQQHDGGTGNEAPANKARAAYPLHPVCFDYADFTEAEAEAMRKSLRGALGLITPIALWRGQIVEGRHRDMLCRELGIDPRYDDVTGRYPTEEAMRAYVAALNEHRRSRTTPLTVTEKRAKTEAALKADPHQSDRAIAESCGVSHTFVTELRAKLAAGGGNVATLPAKRRSRRGKPGEGQRKEQPQQQPVEPQQPAAAEPVADPAAGVGPGPAADPGVGAEADSEPDAPEVEIAKHLLAEHDNALCARIVDQLLWRLSRLGIHCEFLLRAREGRETARAFASFCEEHIESFGKRDRREFDRLLMALRTYNAPSIDEILDWVDTTKKKAPRRKQAQKSPPPPPPPEILDPAPTGESPQEPEATRKTETSNNSTIDLEPGEWRVCGDGAGVDGDARFKHTVEANERGNAQPKAGAHKSPRPNWRRSK